MACGARHRLQVFHSYSNLNEREEDIPLLVRHFIGIFCKKNGRSAFDLSEEQMLRLRRGDQLLLVMARR